LDDFDTKKVNLSYVEKKLIQERVEQAIKIENKRNAQDDALTVFDELTAEQDQLEHLLKKNNEMAEKLAELKLQELELMKEIVEVIVSPAQINHVKGILDEANIVYLRICSMNQLIKESEMTRTRYSKAAFTEISGYIDELLQEKRASNK
jgi:uncharacterized protein YecE (DUF72 family)